ncbi:MAG: glycoside hydrolase family 127 protein [Sedimentisphaerales bacterium]|nr:glycoside hydrolase family 127 protein [Sedimentisphaerales bacterium]
MRTIRALAMVGILAWSLPAAGQAGRSGRPGGDFQKVQAVPFTAVTITDSFWAPRILANQDVTVWHDIDYCEQTGRIRNFAKAAGRLEGKFEGTYFDDSDVYKVLEGAAYCLHARREAKLEAKVDQIIETIAAAQQPDGYLMCYYILNGLDQRWTNCAAMHELYCAGHLFEAAVAYYQATGKRNLLDVAIRLADHIDSVFGPAKKREVPGHEEIELALVKLYEVTGEQRYLNLARFFLDERGRADGHKLYGEYCQDHRPVVEQDQAVGHAVRAGYLYSGMTDIAALTGGAAYADAGDRIWGNIVQTKLYITGGIGARHGGEAFGEDYELPNASAYGETCAAIANILWNQRLFLLHGEAKYIDVLERVLYNGFLSGVSLDGRKFFYVNPLSSAGSHHRQAWYGCACCPTNVVRILPSVGGYVYARDAGGIYVNLYVDSTATIPFRDRSIVLRQRTTYPWDGTIQITVESDAPTEFSLNLRIPGWSQGRPVPSDLYTPVAAGTADPAGAVTGKLNGNNIDIVTGDAGYCTIRRVWSKADRVELHLPMPPQRIRCHPNVKENLDRVALQRGPLVYCLEQVDQSRPLKHLYLPPQESLVIRQRPDLLNGVAVLEGRARVRLAKDAEPETTDIKAVPYYAWDNRSEGAMMVWLPTKASQVRPRPEPTLASAARVSASHCWQSDTPEALNDQVTPERSGDESLPRFTWWPRRGTTEWAQYDWDAPVKVSAVSVYWFDDTGRGSCRVPETWRVLYRQQDQWKLAQNRTDYTVVPDAYNRVDIDPVSCTALRLEVNLGRDVSAGILEWRVR